MKKIVERVVLSIILLVSVQLLRADDKQSHARTKIHLDDEFLKLADGLPGAMDARAFKECFDIRKHILVIMHIPLVYQDRILPTLKELAVREHSFLKNSSPESPEFISLYQDLAALKILFFKSTHQLHEELMQKDMQRVQYMRLINIFAEKINRKDTLLKNLGKADEHAILEKTSAREFFIFLHDLKIFLESLMDSAPKARKAYRAYLSPDDQKVFDAFFE